MSDVGTKSSNDKIEKDGDHKVDKELPKDGESASVDKTAINADAVKGEEQSDGDGENAKDNEDQKVDKESHKDGDDPSVDEKEDEPESDAIKEEKVEVDGDTNNPNDEPKKDGHEKLEKKANKNR